MDVDYSDRDNPEMVPLYDWLRTLERIELPVIRRAIAMYVALKGNADGSSITVGEKRIARITGLGVSTVRKHMDVLRKMGLLHREKRGSGRGRAKEGGTFASTHYLTYPDDMDTLPWRLNPDLEECDEPLTQLPDTDITASRGSVLGIMHRSQAGGDSGPRAVDNSNHRSPEHGDSGQSPLAGDAITARWGPNHRSLDAQSPLAGERQPTRYLPDTYPTTTRGPVSRVPHVAHETTQGAPPIHPVPPPRAPDPAEQAADPPVPAAPDVPQALRVTDADYAAAYELLVALPDGGAFLLARAVAELAGEGFDDAPAPALAVRAAEIATRPESRSA